MAAPALQEDLNKSDPRNSPGSQPTQGTAPGPDRSLLAVDLEVGMQTMALTGHPPLKHHKKAQASTASALSTSAAIAGS